MTFTFFKSYKKLTISAVIVVILVVWMALTGTLSYPGIMIERQYQSIRDCTFGSQDFSTDYYGFSFSVPSGYCVLPNRLFPRDGSIEIVPKGWYFVFNEYAKGSVAGASVATILFEPVTTERDPSKIIQTLMKGRFLKVGDVTSTTTPSGIGLIIASGALGTDGNLYDWAFTTHPNNKFFVGVVGRHAANEDVKQFLLDSLRSH